MSNKNQSLMHLFVPISLGELMDKISILEIKKENMKGIKLENVKKELDNLNSIVKIKNLDIDKNFLSNLRDVNKKLWVIEDKIREKESQNKFDKEFIELARSVYKENDKRASIKKEINLKYNSNFIEEKSYIAY